MGKKLGEAVKAGCRLLARPILPILPSALANRLPFLGQVRIDGPENLQLRFHTYGPCGKDRIAIKLARRGLWGYEGETTRIFLPLAKQARTVIDIGANTGLFALLAAKANPHAKVFAFEPVPFIFDMLQANVRLNALTNVQTIESAVSESTGETTFYISQTHVGVPMDSSACPGFRAHVQPVTVKTTSLDDLVHARRIEALDLIKIDAEATEASIVRGGQAALRTHRPFVICEVLEGLDHAYLEGAFGALRYRFFHMGPGGLAMRSQLTGSLEVDERNYLFAPVEKVHQLSALGLGPEFAAMARAS